MNLSEQKYRYQAILWSCMITIISTVIVVVVYTNITLRSIERNLPNTLLTELNSLSSVLSELSGVVSATKIAASVPKPENIDILRKEIERGNKHVIILRDTYVTNNLVNASAFHAVIAPALADLQIWLEEGISGYPSNSGVTLEIAGIRISEAYEKASRLKAQSQLQAQETLDNQRSRLTDFQHSVTLLLIMTFVIVLCIIYLLFHQIGLRRKEAEVRGKLREQHDLLGNLLQNLPLGVAVWHKNREIAHLNNSFTTITGYSRQDIDHLDKWPMLAYPDPEYREFVTRHWRASVRDNHAASEYRVTCKDGSIKDIEFQAAFLPDSRVMNTLIDVTQRNKNDQALRESREIRARARKMESLGLLAGGVAHDLNNILSGIVSYPELLLIDLAEDHPLRKPIELIQDSGQKATAIVQDLLTVARGVAISKEPVNVNQIVEKYLESPNFKRLHEYHPGVTVETSLAKEHHNILGSRVHILKILMNLVSNGCEAMETSGRVLISTSYCFIDTPLYGYEDVAEGEYVILSVADQGKGINKKDLERIFEPFYSKKVMGRSGTGLGLAVVWNVVQDHGGYIHVKNTSDGTQFQIYLPATQKSIFKEDATTIISEISGNGESILIVDDVPSQRQITEGIAERLGYAVSSVSSGEEAVAFVRTHQIDILLLDMIMAPGINGRQTYEKILAVSPKQKAIIVSGFAETKDVKATLALGASHFLKKPLKIKNLGIAIREALSG